MKKLSVILSILFFCVSACFADDVQSDENKQLVEVENAGGLLLFQKQPPHEKQTQIIRVKKSGGITIIQINGKIKSNADNKKE